MAPSRTTYDVHRVFMQGVLARDIAEPLASFEESTTAGHLLEYLRGRDLQAAALRRNGLAHHVVERARLEAAALAQDEALAGPCLAFARPPTPEELLPDTSTIDRVVVQLQGRDFVLLEVFGAPGGIICRRDLEDPPVRMWLFGLLTLIEMVMVERIEAWAPDEMAWRALLSPARLAKAEVLQEERRRRNLETPLLHCLPLSDKGQIVARAESLRVAMRLPSRKRTVAHFKKLERLRNNLAHVQPIVQSDWDVIVLFATNIAGLLEFHETATLLRDPTPNRAVAVAAP